jgi:hypothetical protein
MNLEISIPAEVIGIFNGIQKQSEKLFEMIRC